jgi:hypothetical protein
MGKGGIRERQRIRGHCLRADPNGSIVEVKKIEGRSFESKEEAELHGLELCKEWIDKRA